MTDKHNNQPQTSGDEFKAFTTEPTAVHFTKDGNFVSGNVRAYNMDKEEVRDVLVNEFGHDPDKTHVSEKQEGKSTGRNMSRAAFGNWNSSWETEADRKKRENAHLN